MIKLMIEAYVAKYIGGKIYYRSQNGKKVSDSKVSSKKDIRLIFHSHPKDDQLTLLCKEVLREALEYFFTKENYEDFLKRNCGAQDKTKELLMKNREQIRDAFFNRKKSRLLD